jgi:hypothetical protein
MNTQWEKPKLIVLGRGRPEEHVLSACKIPSMSGFGRPNCKLKSNEGCEILSSS